MILLGVYLVGLLVDVFLFDAASDMRFFLLTGLWLVVCRLSKFSSRATFLVCLGLLGVMFMFFLFSPDSPITERSASWLYIMMLVGVVQQLLELREPEKKKT